ncbi:MAG: class I SAM-dependent methyltransferase [Solirubrobacteraceae bacterium]
MPEHFALRQEFLLARVKAGQRVLDVGCGEGMFTDALARAGCHAVGTDIAEEPLRRARERFPALDFRVALPTSGEWDAVWAGEVIEHVQDCAGLLDELRSALAHGGRLLLSTPDHPRRAIARMALRRRAFERHFDPRQDHLRFFTARTLRELVEDVGFEQTEVRSQRGVLLLSSYR